MDQRLLPEGFPGRARDPRRLGARVAGPGGLTTGECGGAQALCCRCAWRGLCVRAASRHPGPVAGDSPGSAARGNRYLGPLVGLSSVHFESYTLGLLCTSGDGGYQVITHVRRS